MILFELEEILWIVNVHFDFEKTSSNTPFQKLHFETIDFLFVLNSSNDISGKFTK